MTRAQWLVVAFIGVVAALAYDRSSKIYQYLGLATKQPGKATSTNTNI